MLRVPRFVSPVGGVHTATVSGVVRITAPEPDRNDFTAARRGAKTLVLEGKPVGHRVLRGGWPRPASRTWLPWCSGAVTRGCSPASRLLPRRMRSRSSVSVTRSSTIMPWPSGMQPCARWKSGRYVLERKVEGQRRAPVAAANTSAKPLATTDRCRQIWNIALPTTGDRRSRTTRVSPSRQQVADNQRGGSG